MGRIAQASYFCGAATGSAVGGDEMMQTRPAIAATRECWWSTVSTKARDPRQFVAVAVAEWEGGAGTCQDELIEGMVNGCE